MFSSSTGRKFDQFIFQYQIDTGYDLMNTVKYIAQFLRCSQDEIISGALKDEAAAQYLIGVMRRLQAQKEN